MVLTGVADGALVIAHPRGRAPRELTLLIDGVYQGSLTSIVEAAAGGAGLKSLNQIADPEFETTMPWALETPGDAVVAGVGFSKKWNLEQGNAAYVHHLRTQGVGLQRLVYRDPVEGERLTVTPGVAYAFGAFFGQHRADVRIVVTFLDTEGRALATAEAAPGEERRGGARYASYALAQGDITAPVEACWATIAVHVQGRVSERRSDSLLLLARPWFGQAGRKTGDRWRKVTLSPAAVAAMRELDRSAVRSRYALPADLYDGRPRRIDVQDAEGRSVLGAPLVLELADPAIGVIEGVSGAAVFGWARPARGSSDVLNVRLVVDGRPAGVARADQRNRRAKGHGYRLQIPNRFMDGLVHRISVLSARSGRVLAETVEFLAVSKTAFDKLQRYGAVPRVWQSPAARQRYEALQAALRAIETTPADDRAAALERLAQISRAHDVLLTGFDMVRGPYAPLSFPVHPKPRVSVVIPAHNKFGVTYYCLSALLFAGARATFEVIVVDDGSSDETLRIEDIVSGITVVRHESALGFVDACNDGVARASGEFVVLLNNDTEPTVGWLDEMLATFDNFDDVGIVGAKLVYPDGRLQEAGGIVWNSGDPANYGRGGNAADPKFNYVRQADYLSGACIMLPAALWSKLGGLSEIYRPAYFEDTDLCFKVKAEGLKVVYNPFCLVYHFEGVSSGTDVTSGMKRFQEINRPTFKARWTELYKDNGEVGVDVDLNKDRGVARRALMVDLQFPRGDNDAGSYAAIQEVRLLQSLGFKVTFAPRNGAYLGRHTERIQKMGVEAVYAPYVRSVEELLEARGGEFDLVYVTRYTVAQDILPLIRRHAPQARIAFCNADLHFLREMREAVLMESGPLMQKADATREAEMAVVAAADVTLSYNDVEHEIMQAAAPGVRIAQAPWVVDVSTDVPGFEARRDVTFLGGFAHPPNRLAVEFFARDVIPGLRDAMPDVTCNVFGSGMSDEVEALGRDGLAIRGFAPDLKGVYDGCRVFVAPLLTGAGLKGKVVDALAYGTPSVLSPIAAEGANLRDGVEVLIARTPHEWVEAITRLYQDPDLWAAMSRAAQAHARRYYSFETAQAQMQRALALGGLSVEPDPRNLVTRKARLSQG
ncbi:hypothetical protein ASG17_13250 [Brevundimonas sp. Leaf363]|nr:hypothetical protein ASG17_13250 [Brevundimonas sp. Leaf363]